MSLFFNNFPRRKPFGSLPEYSWQPPGAASKASDIAAVIRWTQPITQIQQRDQNALGHLAPRNLRCLYRFVLRLLRDSWKSEEITQDVYRQG